MVVAFDPTHDSKTRNVPAVPVTEPVDAQYKEGLRTLGALVGLIVDGYVRNSIRRGQLPPGMTAHEAEVLQSKRAIFSSHLSHAATQKGHRAEYVAR